MKLLKNTIVGVCHKRHGKFTGIVLKDFDTDVEEFYPIAVYQYDPVIGLSTVWNKGDEIPCRKSMVELFILDEMLTQNSN